MRHIHCNFGFRSHCGARLDEVQALECSGQSTALYSQALLFRDFDVT